MAKRRFVASADTVQKGAGIFQITDFSFSDSVSQRDTPEGGIVFDGLSVLICRKGEYVVFIGGRKYVLSSNEVLIMMPYRIVRPVSHSDDCQITGFFLGIDYYLKNNSSTIDYNIILQLNDHPLVPFTQEQMNRLCDLNSVIAERIDNLGRPYSNACVNSLVAAFLAEIKSVCESSSMDYQRVVPTRQESITDNFFRLLFLNYTQERTVAYYAGRLCLGSKHLSSIIKKVTGFTALEWINEVTVNRMKSFLKTTNLTVLQISQELNFSNPSFFCKYFKQYTGQTPLEFKYDRPSGHHS